MAPDRFFFFPVKMSDDELSAVDSWHELFTPPEFFFSKNGQCKTVGLNFYERQYVEKHPVIYVLQIDCSKIKLDDKFRISKKLLHATVYLTWFAI